VTLNPTTNQQAAQQQKIQSPQPQAVTVNNEPPQSDLKTAATHSSIAKRFVATLKGAFAPLQHVAPKPSTLKPHHLVADAIKKFVHSARSALNAEQDAK
jgi:hypothetical protein